MAKGQQKSNREVKKPKKKPEEKVSGSGLTIKSSGSSYKDRYAKPTSSK
jgi:hypothetical protein